MKTTEEVADFICQQIKTMIGPGIVGATLLDESTQMASVKGLQGLDDAKVISAGLKLAGTDPRQIQISINEISPEQMAIYNSGRLEIIEGGFYTIFAHKYSKVVSAAIERLINIRFVYAMGFLHNGRNIGGVAIFTDSKDAIEANKAMIEIIVSHAADVINRIRIEQIEEDNNARYKMMFESAPIAINITEGTNITYANSSYLNMFGYLSLDELKIVAPLELFAPEFRSQVFDNIQRRRAGLPVPRSYEAECLRKDGSRFPILMHLATMKFADGPATVGFIQDITESRKIETDRRRLEEKAQISSRLSAVGEMAAGIAHEINNPLTGVIGFSELLIEKNDVPEDIKEDLRIINDGSKRVKDIVKRLLTFARQTKPAKAKININDLINTTFDLRSYVLRTNDIEIVKHLDPDLPCVTVDPGQMQQVFLNLIVNAEHAMKQARGRGTLTVTTENRGSHIQITFKDDGIGMSQETKDKLFNPFFTTKQVNEGTGLGLSLSRSIIVEHRGTIDVESQPGQGATFIITLCVTPPSEQALPEAVFEKASPLKNQGTHILVVDDEDAIRKLVSTLLSQIGYTVETTGDAKEALLKIDDVGYGAVIVDIRMPGMSGIELFNTIKPKRPELAGRFIFITGDTSDENTRVFLEENELSYINKPFDTETLTKKVNDLLWLKD
jgi:PAS domain S-box-containing protein